MTTQTMFFLFITTFWFIIGADNYECGGNYDLFADKIITSLESSGYAVEEGAFSWLKNQSSYAANPSLYYTIFGFNRANISLNISTYDIVNDDDFGWGSIKSGIRGHEDLNKTYYLYGSSAVIWYGCLPPSYYFSFLMYQNRRWNPLHPSLINNDSQINNEKYPISHSYSSLGDMLNAYNINRTNNGLTIIIFTADNKTYSDIKQTISPYLHLLNLTNMNQINLNIMPYKNISIQGPGFGGNEKTKNVNIYYLKYGNDELGFLKQILNREPLDSFSLMGRSGLPFENGTKNGMFTQYLNTKQKIYKIYFNHSSTNSNWDVPRQPYAAPYIVNTSTGIYEQDTLEPFFTNYVNSIYKYFNVRNKNKYFWRYLSTKISRPGYLANNFYGFNCLKYGTRCMADNRDSQYFVSWPDVQVMTNTSIFFVIGVVHEDTGKAEWENIVPMFANSGVNDKFYRSHFLDYLAEEYRYSAMTFPPFVNKTIPENILNKFFIVAAMRPEMCSKYFDDNSRYPVLKNVPKFCFDDDDYGYNTSQKWFIVNRNYMNPITHTRSDANEMIPFVVMQFESQWFEFNTA